MGLPSRRPWRRGRQIRSRGLRFRASTPASRSSHRRRISRATSSLRMWNGGSRTARRIGISSRIFNLTRNSGASRMAFSSNELWFMVCLLSFLLGWRAFRRVFIRRSFSVTIPSMSRTIDRTRKCVGCGGGLSIRIHLQHPCMVFVDSSGITGLWAMCKTCSTLTAMTACLSGRGSTCGSEDLQDAKGAELQNSESGPEGGVQRDDSLGMNTKGRSTPSRS